MDVANQKLWNQTSKMRNIHARMFLSEVTAERGQQLLQKAEVAMLEAAEKAEFHKEMLLRLAVCSTSDPTYSVCICHALFLHVYMDAPW